MIIIYGQTSLYYGKNGKQLNVNGLTQKASARTSLSYRCAPVASVRSSQPLAGVYSTVSVSGRERRTDIVAVPYADVLDIETKREYKAQI